MSTLITNAVIMTMDDDDRIIEGSVLVENGIIKKVIPHQPGSGPRIAAEETIDGSDMLIMPGMTNAHYHSYSNLLKGTTSHFPLEIWSLYTTAYGYSLEDGDITNAVLLGMIDMIKSGVTSCIDHFPHIRRSGAALKAYEAASIRVGFAPMMHDVPDHHFLPVDLPDELRRKLDEATPISVDGMRVFYHSLFEEWHGRKNIQILLGPNAPQRCSEGMLALCKELSEQRGAHIHTHLLETRIQKEVGDAAFPDGIIGRLRDQQLLSRRLSGAHSIWIDDEEAGVLAEHGVSLVHNPVSNMMLGSGRAKIGSYLQKGMNVALGTDSSNCGISHNLFEAMRIAVIHSRQEQPDFGEWLQPKDVLNMATVGGARLLGQEKRGRIKQGYEADLVLLSRRSPALAVGTDLYAQLVYYENGSSVDSVMIKGEWVLKERKMVLIDEEALLRSVNERQKSLFEKSRESLSLANALEPHFTRMYKKFHSGFGKDSTFSSVDAADEHGMLEEIGKSH
ncbi:amidohydrolase family protein [Fictibacillus phosphorivorans]|uniref:amidohydrolase family protein n=1 Tax=Fictibacillus phosphorivorans TaxID=1221500 RepID=UPI00203B9CAB|nr:amidohydrolase family protein [Fictibacillus phosphorivorans]MCM3718637.1 amidohydrolase family protein [Fictibacillus phosphorivorans]MCM3776260.1 amidohydrolase family protein [Fictibacillus phosphorivorans]